MSDAEVASNKRKREDLEEWQRKGKLDPRFRLRFPDEEEDDVGRGKIVVGLLGYGQWRRVPGWPTILASSLGYIMTKGAKRVRDVKPRTRGDMRVRVGGKKPFVHNLVCRAFHGPARADQTVDHGIDGKFGKGGDPSDNREFNLRWATPTEQNFNKKKHKLRSDGRPCLVWVVGDGADRWWFPNSGRAAEALGLDPGNLSSVFNPKGKSKTAKNRKTDVVYTGCWEKADDDAPNLPGEKWRDTSEQTRYKNLPKDRCYVSNRGRTWARHANGDGWHRKTRVMPTKGIDYARVKVGGTLYNVHVLVGELFFIGPRPLNWKVWDHIKSEEKWNNDILNLHPTTREVNGVNTSGHRAFFIWPEGDPSKKVLWNEGQSAAADKLGIERRNLVAVLHNRRTTVGGYCAAFVEKEGSDSS